MGNSGDRPFNDRSDEAHAAVDLDHGGPTPEVGSEGGSPGDVEIGIDQGPATGSEAGETWRPTTRRRDEVVGDSTGEGRRNP